jgi:amidophosphoribosyltransferase
MEGGHSIDAQLTHGDTPQETWRDECGVFGIVGHPKAAQLTYYALFALQHRGEESAGIATVDGLGSIFHAKGMGLVGEAIAESELHELEHGHSGIGHVRYSTAGASRLADAQPLVFSFQHGNMALAHNGNLVNAPVIRSRLERGGAIFQTSSDTEVVAHLLVRRNERQMADRIRAAMRMVIGGYALCILTDDTLYAMRDPHGLRPLVLGRVDGAWCVASETCAFNTIGAEFVRDVEPGELLVITHGGVESVKPLRTVKRALCTFEHIYFARPDSDMDGHSVHETRTRFGRLLHEDHLVDADVVIGVPDSSLAAAMGYAAASGIPYDVGLVKSHYIGRSFIQPSQELRARRVRLKLNPVRSVLAGKRVIMIDDSLVRGTTCTRIVRLLRDAGAAEVHVLIASPPVTHPCHYGIDTARRSELLAAHNELEQMRTKIGADSLAFLSEAAMMKAFTRGGAPDAGHCNACFNGRYPTEVDAEPVTTEISTFRVEEAVLV